MTEEEDFRRQLDTEPDSRHLRLVFADWLDEQGDPRGPGYRALGILGRRPLRGRSRTAMRTAQPEDGCEWYDAACPTSHRTAAAVDGVCDLPSDWFRLLRRGVGSSDRRSRYYLRRYNAEDDAALAFARLPAERQRELLSGATR